jgi:glucose/arabinose dehydrogenase
MSPRALASLVTALAALCLPAGAARADVGPAPTASGGQTVTQVADGMHTPTAFAFGDGEVFAADGSYSGNSPTGGVYVLTRGHAVRLPGSPSYAAGLAWRHGTLYISAQTRLLAWSAWNGSSFARRRTIFSGQGRFPGFNGLGFGADGRLYTGTSVAEGPSGDDHGPTSIPHARQLLSFTVNGKDMRVVARGIRQPWQLAFPARSSTPFVTDLAQDDGTDEAAVPDFVLRIKPGQNYGFPGCNWVVLKACAGRPRPFRFLAPHTDPMGLAIIGTQLYIAEYGTQSPGPRVVSMPTTGGALTPLLTGFAQPIVALAAHGGALYVGEQTGQVFSVRP